MDRLEVIYFVTGKLAAPSVRHVVSSLAEEFGFAYSIDVLPITVAALMTPQWLLRHLHVPASATRVIVPGYLQNGLSDIQRHVDVPVVCGPKDVRDLPEIFGKKRVREDDFGQHQIEILAEINFAPRMGIQQLVECAKSLCRQGADMIDLGCEPGFQWRDAATAVRACRDEGLRVSIDTFDAWEAEQAVRAGASLVLSVNRSNCESAADWGVEVVVVPDESTKPNSGLLETVEYLDSKKIPFRLDPVLEPIGCGFAASLNRFWTTRQQFPEAEIMMGVGNLTELTDVDSAGINTLLLGYCEELKIRSILTTQVINWARTSVQECDAARQLVHYAVRHQIPPKRLDERLLMLRDPRLKCWPTTLIDELASSIRDNNYRILIDGSEIHLISANVHLRGTDPFEMLSRLMALPESRNVDGSHAFYLGYELSKALTALTLGKNYEQDESLNWGMLTRPETRHRLPRGKSVE